MEGENESYADQILTRTVKVPGGVLLKITSKTFPEFRSF